MSITTNSVTPLGVVVQKLKAVALHISSRQTELSPSLRIADSSTTVLTPPPLTCCRHTHEPLVDEVSNLSLFTCTMHKSLFLLLPTSLWVTPHTATHRFLKKTAKKPGKTLRFFALLPTSYPTRSPYTTFPTSWTTKLEFRWKHRDLCPPNASPPPYHTLLVPWGTRPHPYD